MNELSNLDQLTDKIYEEGISKAEKESKVILSNAEKERKQIIEKAYKEAEQIVSNAKREAERLGRSVEKEMQLKGKQLIGDLQQEIQYLLNERILVKAVKGSFADEDFVKMAILEALKSWQDERDLELSLPKTLENKLGHAFQNSIEQQARNLTITFSGHFSGGFRIGIKDGTYQISFTEQDFIHLFQPYLTQQAQRILFSES